MTDTIDFTGARVAVVNGLVHPIGLSEEDRELAALAPDDGRWARGQHLQAIGPRGHPKHETARTQVVAVEADGYRVAKHPGMASGFIHNNAQAMWIAVVA